MHTIKATSDLKDTASKDSFQQHSTRHTSNAMQCCLVSALLYLIAIQNFSMTQPQQRNVQTENHRISELYQHSLTDM